MRLHRLSPLLLALSLLAPASQAAPAADPLVRQHLAAVGDLAQLQTRRITLRAIGMAPFELPIVVEARRPDQLRRAVDIQGQVQLTGFDGQKAWHVDPFVPGGRAELDAGELATLREEALFDGLLAHALAKGWTIEDLGSENVDGQTLRKLRTALPGQHPVTIYLDPASLLERKRVQLQRIQGKELQVESRSSDYRRVGGLMLAHRVDIAIQGLPHPMQMRVEAVELNPVLPVERFQAPVKP